MKAIVFFSTFEIPESRLTENLDSLLPFLIVQKNDSKGYHISIIYSVQWQRYTCFFIVWNISGFVIFSSILYPLSASTSAFCTFYTSPLIDEIMCAFLPFCNASSQNPPSYSFFSYLNNAQKLPEYMRTRKIFNLSYFTR